ncbi:Uncharacterised protein [Vibrio cholerae]|nr:Uncharacterised protein [Vibrio cholerae]CSI34024.1 Uncharacterised protein [Vibrio cholerae]
MIDSRNASRIVTIRSSSSLRKLLKVWIPPPVKKRSFGSAEYSRSNAASNIVAKSRFGLVSNHSNDQTLKVSCASTRWRRSSITDKS